MSLPSTLLALVPAALLALLPGCVSLQRGGIFPEDRDEVYVEIFWNDTFFREVEFFLADAIVTEINSRPGLSLTSKEGAEVILTGRVVKVRQSVLSEDPTRTVTAGSSTVTAVIQVLDARTGDVLKEKRLTQRGEFVPDLSETQDDARLIALAFLARDIVRELEAEF